ncbi:MAG: LCP family protein [Oscillospiraceae bacterium]|jgi:LCP family protein required for cell wall assembly|nr:LCP family protein [Oscillospiraceae bacterium]
MATKRYARPPRDPKRKKRKWVPALIAGIFLLLLVGTPFLLLHLTLGQMDRHPELLPSMDGVGEDAPLDPAVTGLVPEFQRANKALDQNAAERIIYDDADVINILLAGIDYGAEEGKAHEHWGRSDAMILISIHKVKKTIQMVSLSRAAYVTIPGFWNDRLNMGHAYGGPELMVQTVEENFKIKLDGWMTTGFDSFVRIIDLLGGVNITVTQAEYDALKEVNHLTEGAAAYDFSGAQTLQYVRLRHIDSDRARTQRQRNVLNAIAAKARTAQLATLRKALMELFPLVQTNLGNMELLSFIPYVLYPVTETTIPAAGTPLSIVDLPTGVSVEVMFMDWPAVREDVGNLLFYGIAPRPYIGNSSR